jgi:polyhydroxybutyrate depolymerase
MAIITGSLGCRHSDLTRVKKTQRALAIVLGVIALGSAAFFLYWAYVVDKYGQHLPLKEISVGGLTREYHLFVPATLTEEPMPLVILLNGGSAGSWRFPQQFDWQALGEEKGFIIAVPVGKLVPPNEGAWQLNSHAGAYHDINFVKAMIDDIASSNTLDASRHYAVGYSLGSMFSYEFACQLSDRFAALASFAGSMPLAQKDCEPARNVPLLHIHGVLDPIIVYNNTWEWKSWASVGTMHDIPGLIDFWRNRYQCQTEQTTSFESETHLVYDDCRQDSRIEHYRLTEADHGWPETLMGEPTYTVLWSFLNRHALEPSSP